MSVSANERKKISAASSTDKNIKQSPSRLSRLISFSCLNRTLTDRFFCPVSGKFKSPLSLLFGHHVNTVAGFGYSSFNFRSLITGSLLTDR